MDKEILEALSNLLDEKLKPIHIDIKEMKTGIKDLKIGQEKIISKLDEVESVNANNHVEMLNSIKDLSKNITNVEIITSSNWNDIAKLKLVK